MDTITILAARFDHRALIHAAEIYDIISPRPKNPERTATEAISRGKFPVATIKINGRRYVRLVDLAALIDAGKPETEDNHLPDARRRGPGRPRKMAEGAP